MSERKVINKYYPPDFDPSKIVKKKKKVKTGSASLPTVRLMTPFSMKCLNCGEYISRSRKFNARKENTSETYLGMKIVRFHIKCPRCASEILFRTDPKSADYVIEFGAQKNYDSGNTNKLMKEETLEDTLARLEKEEEEAKLKELQKDKKQTSLEELEAKLNDIRHQQELSEQIDDLRERNSRLNDLAKDAQYQNELKAKLRASEEEKLQKQNEEDERLAEEAFNQTKLGIIKPKSTINSITKQNKIEIHNKNDDNNDNNDDNDEHNDDDNNITDNNDKSQKENDSDSDSDSDGYEQPLFTKAPEPPKKLTLKRKSNSLGISVKKSKT
ncbi:Coiled-coil domain-containing protein [Wickerhamomyces ciferrii]|uniref:Splicing factor YJU2 n=1 Tax=Wickerhamomyces ciferrii (strain ATCC 14091 / BCRC 22168 / CBS 111 / JCM 3599 / NBRC 0793 / NRRL Y-1031 F-60-10) TaxID=1206466 RepID=K0KVT9_WICCF|nr:Coiled-coil domain-containing protein [Wickerhamomyces ciferrii]CCH46082.1 Coiled-coil domain-containing protein [Wickerhamomyces ciferrii]